MLDSGRYNFIQNISKDFPAGTVTGYSVRSGDSLQSIAAAVYGDAGLWYVLAEANGLQAGEALKGGVQLVVPNHITNASLNADTHRVYNESDIIGSTLPNLQTPPPKKKKGCAQILAIILVVVIAVFAPALVGPLAGTIGTALGTSAFVSTIIAGAIIGAAVSIVSQGILIAAGLQEKFSWKAVAAGAISGAFAGAAQGIESAAKLGTLKELGMTAQYAKTAAVALKVASVGVRQIIESGKITSWTSLAAAGIGQAYSFDKAAAIGDAVNAGTDVDKIKAAESAYKAAEKAADAAQKTLSYVTPWVQLAETAIRNDGKLQPADWANAIGATLEQAVTSNTGGGFLGQNFQSKVAVNLLVGGALSAFDKDAGVDYLINSVGNTVGAEIGGALVNKFNSKYAAPASAVEFDPVLGAFVNGETREPLTDQASRLAAASNGAQVASVSGTRIDGILSPDEEAYLAAMQNGGPAKPDPTADVMYQFLANEMYGLGSGGPVYSDSVGIPLAERISRQFGYPVEGIQQTALPDSSLDGVSALDPLDPALVPANGALDDPFAQEEDFWLGYDLIAQNGGQVALSGDPSGDYTLTRIPGSGSENGSATDIQALSAGLKKGDRGEEVASLQRALGIKDDGVFGRQTQKALDAYLGTGGSSNSSKITRDQLATIMPNAGRQVDVYLDPLNSAMERHGINTPGQQAAFLAQVGVESGQLRSTNENLNYSARRLTKVWRSRFPNEEVAAPYANNPEALGNFVYANRLGNGNEASGDGYRYRGGGLMQTTGRANYRAAGFEDNPEALREPTNAANSAGRFWIDNGLNDRTAVTLNRTQFNAITAVVNGGQHGATARYQIYQRAVQVLGR